MINIKKNISVKSYYRFVEFLSKLCGSTLPHERYKQISLDVYEAQSAEEISVKRLSNAFLYVLNNTMQTLDTERLNTIYCLLTNSSLDGLVLNKILKRYYINSNNDTLHKAVYIHNHIISLDINRKMEFAFLMASYVMLKYGRGAIIPFGSMFDEYHIATKRADEEKLLFLFKQMEDESKDEGTDLAKMTSREVIDIVKPHLNYIKNAFKIKNLCLYGSVVKGVVNESSDIDFLIDFDDGLIDYEKGEFREKLSKYLKEILHCKADLVYFDHALTHLDIQEMNNLIVLIKQENEI